MGWPSLRDSGSPTEPWALLPRAEAPTPRTKVGESPSTVQSFLLRTVSSFSSEM